MEVEEPPMSPFSKLAFFGGGSSGGGSGGASPRYEIEGRALNTDLVNALYVYTHWFTL